MTTEKFVSSLSFFIDIGHEYLLDTQGINNDVYLLGRIQYAIFQSQYLCFKIIRRNIYNTLQYYMKILSLLTYVSVPLNAAYLLSTILNQ